MLKGKQKAACEAEWMRAVLPLSVVDNSDVPPHHLTVPTTSQLRLQRQVVERSVKVPAGEVGECLIPG
jgi:hypothetical protein